LAITDSDEPRVNIGKKEKLEEGSYSLNEVRPAPARWLEFQGRFATLRWLI
jgi:hypothetical protein